MSSSPRSLIVIIPDGNPHHLQKVVGSADCVMMIVSREYCQTHNLFDVKELTLPALYVLADDDRKVYIGQAKQFAERVKDHLVKKPWWTRAYVFVSDGRRYHTASIEYLEYLAIRAAQMGVGYDCSENKQTPSNPTLPIYERPQYDEVFEQIKFFLEYERCFAFNTGEDKEEQVLPQMIFSMTYKKCLSTGYIEDWETRRFCLQKGSEISPITTPSFNSKQQRDNLLKHCSKGKGGIFILDKDYSFSSPSMAATCCAGHPQNGLTSWKDSDGILLKQHIENKQK